MSDYAGFWIRVGAYLIDSIILGVAGAIVGGIAGVILGVSVGDALGGQEQIVTVAELIGNLIALVMGFLYFVLMESSSRRATLGKIVVGIEVSDEHGRQLSLGRAVGRYFAKFISALILGIGFLMVGWTERKQGLHDMIAGTLVTSRGTFRDTMNQADVFR